jgi:hypothetical protein
MVETRIAPRNFPKGLKRRRESGELHLVEFDACCIRAVCTNRRKLYLQNAQTFWFWHMPELAKKIKNNGYNIYRHISEFSSCPELAPERR